MKNFIKSLGILGILLLIPLSAQATTLFPSGGGTGTSTAPTLGQVLIGNSSGTYSPMATSSLGISGGGSFATTSINGVATTTFTFATTSASGLTLSIIPGTGILTFSPGLDAGFIIPTTASTTNYDTFYATPSDRITAGTNLSWSGNTLNAAGSGFFSTTSINNLATTTFVFSTTSTGTDFSISTTSAGVQFNLPTASASNRGALSSADWLSFTAAAASTTALNPSYLRGLFSNTVTGLTYSNTTGITSLTAGFTIPLTASTTEWAAASASTTALTPSYLRGLFSNSATGLTYNNSTGATSLTAGFNIPLTASTSAWQTFLIGGAATTTWKSTVQAWFYPDVVGSQACLAQGEYQDGRQIHTLKPEYFRLQTDGTLDELDVGEAANACNGFSTANATNTLAYSAEQYITVSGNTAGVTALVASSTAMTNFMNSVVQMATSTNLTGIELDIEGYGSWSTGTTNGYYTFVTNLGNLLHSNGKKLMIDLPPIWNSSTFPSTVGAQWSSVNSTNFYELNYQSFNGLPVDYLVILGYDYQFDWGAGTPIQPLQWVADIITFASAKITDTNRIVIGMPAYGYYGTTGGFSLTSNQSYNDMAGQPGFNTAVRQASSSELMWEDAGISYVYNDATSLETKRLFIENHGIKHVSIWSLGGNKWFTPGRKMELGNLLSPTLTSNGWQTQGNDTYYSFGNVGIGDVDFSPFPASTLNLFGSSTDTAWVDDSSNGLSIDNVSSTTNNWIPISFNNNLGQLVGAINAQVTNHTLRYGRISIGVRGPSGFLQTLNIFDGNVGVGSTTPSARLTVTNTGTSTVMFDALSGSQGNCLVLKDADGSGYTYVVANNGVLTASTNDCR